MLSSPIKKFNPVDDFIQHKINIISDYYDSIEEYKLHALDIRRWSKREKDKCVRIYILLEDTRSVEDNGQKRWSEQHALSCNFPKREDTGFELRYYQRYYDENKDSSFSNKADELFRSVKIKDRPMGVTRILFKGTWHEHVRLGM